MRLWALGGGQQVCGLPEQSMRLGTPGFVNPDCEDVLQDLDCDTVDAVLEALGCEVNR